MSEFMLYQSTRGGVQNISFEEAVMMGLADDGGLLVPQALPDLSHLTPTWQNLSFEELAIELMSHFVGDSLSKEELTSIVHQSYSTFTNSHVTPVVSVGKQHVLELFHGPTLAFKDVALQFLGNVFELFLKRRNQVLNVIGATSGDTGSAAIYGLRGKQGIQVMMLHPKGRVSPVQERQMTTVLDENIHNVAIDGTFDDAQNIVKALFNDLPFKQEHHLGAVNSINWARVMAQMTYYFYAYFQVCSEYGSPVVFSVPTGNFGDVLAGYYAKRLGLPIEKLIVATNQNDILYRFFSQGHYHQKGVQPSLSPAMDIQISSNFERFLFHLCEDAQQVQQWMQTFTATGKLTLEGELLTHAQQIIHTERASDDEIVRTIQQVHEQHQYLLDPHTAVGWHACQSYETSAPKICLATAHPAKFGDAIQKAIAQDPPLPESLQGLDQKPTRCLDAKADAQEIRKLLMQI